MSVRGRPVVPLVVVEAAARVAGAIYSVQGGTGSGREARVRGLLREGRCGGAGLRIGRRVEIEDEGAIRLGDSVTIYSGTALLASHPGFITIGSFSHVDRNSTIYGHGGVTIGRKCAIAAGTIIYSQTNQYGGSPKQPVVDQPVLRMPVLIGDDVWIGAGAIILPGVKIGTSAVVAAGAVVRDAVSEGTIVGGVPARVIGERE